MPRGIVPHSGAFDEASPESVPSHIRLFGLLFRSIFILALLVATVWVARPQSATNWMEHFTVGDFIRVMLGVAACLWMVVHLFKLPKDQNGYRTWFYFGLAIIPLVVICAIVFWE